MVLLKMNNFIYLYAIIHIQQQLNCRFGPYLRSGSLLHVSLFLLIAKLLLKCFILLGHFVSTAARFFGATAVRLTLFFCFYIFFRNKEDFGSILLARKLLLRTSTHSIVSGVLTRCACLE